MKPSYILLSLAFFACLLTSCETTSTVVVATASDPAAHFGKYKTYTLAPPKSGQMMSPAGEAALRDAVRAELSKRGITEASGKKADLDVVRHVFVQEKVAVDQYTDWGYAHQGAWPYSYGYYGMWAGAPVTYTDYTFYGEGTLVLDFVDAHTKKLVFRGVGKAVVGGAEANAEKVREAVEKIMAAYPTS